MEEGHQVLVMVRLASLAVVSLRNQQRQNRRGRPLLQREASLQLAHASCDGIQCTSGADRIPKGMRFHRYLPNGVLNVVRYDEPSSSFTCQKTFLTSSSVNTLAPCKPVVTSSMVVRGQ